MMSIEREGRLTGTERIGERARERQSERVSVCACVCVCVCVCEREREQPPPLLLAESSDTGGRVFEEARQHDWHSLQMEHI